MGLARGRASYFTEFHDCEWRTDLADAVVFWGKSCRSEGRTEERRADPGRGRGSGPGIGQFVEFGAKKGGNFLEHGTKRDHYRGQKEGRTTRENGHFCR